MGLISKIHRTITQRPFFFFKYARETLLFINSHFLLKIFKPKNVKIGANLHSISPFVFQAEMPDAHIDAGDDMTSWGGVKIYAWGKGEVKIGNFCSFGSKTIIHCRDSVQIGNHTLISWNVLITDFDAHSLKLEERMAEIEYTKNMLWPNFSKKQVKHKSIYTPGFITKPIIIEDGVWIGANATILKGSKIGRGSIIGANAVVSGEIPPMCIAAGNPARVVRSLT